MTNPNEFNTRIAPTWCPGCGNFGIWGAIKNALVKQKLSHDQVLFVYDVGCSGNMADFLQTYGIHSLHGRAIPVAVGASLAHHQFPTVAIGGDGGLYGEGVEHFIEACRGNFNITALVHNNRLYSLTTGQRSPTAQKGKKTKSTPFGVIEIPFEPLKTAILHDAGFVSRGFAADIPHLTELITQAMQHPGFSLIDVLQPCPTFNKDMPYSWYQERVYKLESNEGLPVQKAMATLDQDPEKMAIGVLYRSKRPAYHTYLPQLKKAPLLHQPIKSINISDLNKSFR